MLKGPFFAFGDGVGKSRVLLVEDILSCSIDSAVLALDEA